jgi:hypothetical protein
MITKKYSRPEKNPEQMKNSEPVKDPVPVNKFSSGFSGQKIRSR